MWNIAHRGGAGLLPENTHAAFEAAIARGCDGAELDVRLCADAVVVVHHDARLNPALTRRGGAWLHGPTPRLKDLDFAALQAFDIGTPDPASAYARNHPLLRPVAGARIPALADIVALPRPPDFLFFVELKSDGDPGGDDPGVLAEAAVKVCAGCLDRVVFVGFDWRGLARVGQIAPAARRWFTTDRLQGDPRPVLDAIAAQGGDGWFAHFADATTANAAAARERGLQVGAWTVNDPAEMRIRMGLDAICTDRPDLLQALE